MFIFLFFRRKSLHKITFVQCFSLNEKNIFNRTFSWLPHFIVLSGLSSVIKDWKVENYVLANQRLWFLQQSQCDLTRAHIWENCSLENWLKSFLQVLLSKIACHRVRHTLFWCVDEVGIWKQEYLYHKTVLALVWMSELQLWSLNAVLLLW